MYPAALSTESQLADHHARIVNIEKEQAATSRKLDWLIALILTTLIATVAGLIKHA